MSALIIGAGPAGISAALYILRGGKKAVVINSGASALLKTTEIENYYGFEKPISGESLFNAGIAQARRLGAEINDGEVADITFDGENYVVTLTDGKLLYGECALICSGSPRRAPAVNGIERLEGHGVSHCAVCDAFFYRGKPVCVLGSGEFAAHEAAELTGVAGGVTIISNGEPLTASFPDCDIIDKKAVSLEGEEKLNAVVFDDGSRIETTGLFIAVGSAGSGELAMKLGAPVENGRIITDESMSAGLPGLYAAGDCCVVNGRSEPLQIARAVYQGAAAGMSALKFLRDKAAKNKQAAIVSQ